MNLCSPQLGLSPNSNLGGEVFDREILFGLAKKGVNIQVILPNGKPMGKLPQNFKVLRISPSHFPAILFNLLIIMPLFKINTRNKISVIRLHQPQFVGLGALVHKIFNRRVKIVATYHQFRETRFWIFSKKIINIWDHIICDSDNVKQKIVTTYQVPSRKITVVHNGVPAYLKPAAKNKKILDNFNIKNEVVLLFMGFFIERKNPLFLLDVILKVKQRYPQIVLIFWGTGDQEEAIFKKAKRLNLLKNIRIQGPVFGPEKNLIHNISDIFVLPSLDEGFALAPLEAMTCAKPVVMNKSHSASEAVTNDQNGYLCKLNDVDDWTEKLMSLVQSKALRKKMGEASLKKAKQEFQWGISVDKHLKVLKSLI